MTDLTAPFDRRQMLALVTWVLPQLHGPPPPRPWPRAATYGLDPARADRLCGALLPHLKTLKGYGMSLTA